MDEICANCGVTKGALYHHFTTKDDLLGLVMTAQMSDYMEEAIENTERMFPQDVPRQIVSWVHGISCCAIDNQQHGYIFKGRPSEQGWFPAGETVCAHALKNGRKPEFYEMM